MSERHRHFWMVDLDGKTVCAICSIDFKMLDGSQQLEVAIQEAYRDTNNPMTLHMKRTSVLAPASDE